MISPTTKIRCLLTAVIMLLAVVSPTVCVAAAKAPVWEVVQVLPQDASSVPVEESDASQPSFDVRLIDGYVYISVESTVKVEVFTILGQLVTSRTIKPGTVRLHLGSRGIYIFKGAGTTRRVNL